MLQSRLTIPLREGEGLLVDLKEGVLDFTLTLQQDHVVIELTGDERHLAELRRILNYAINRLYVESVEIEDAA